MARGARSVKSAPTFDPFIVSTSLDKTDSETRKFIRSHVMRGKNKGKSMPRKGKKARAADPDTPPKPSPPSPVQDGDPGWEHWQLVTPRKVASELSLFRFTQELNPSMKELIFRAFTVVKPATYAVQLFGVDEDHSNGMFCFNDLSSHPAMVPSLLFTAQAFRDMMMGSPLGSLAHTHLAKCLRLLKSSLEDEEEATSYSTMVVVSALATAAIILGDLETAGKHLDGLKKMVEVRGGLLSLGPLNMITYKALTLDLGLAMGTGSEPRFCLGDISWSPYMAYGPSGRRFSELDALQPRPDPRLLNIWADLREFSRAANDVEDKKIAMKRGLFYRLSTSTLYRLLHLGFEPRSLSELLRLSLLAYTKTLMIRLPGLGKRMTFLAGQLETALNPLPAAGHDGSALLFWALMISAISIFEDCDQDWLCQSLLGIRDELGLQTWPEAKAILKRFLWVDSLHDQQGRALFEKLCLLANYGQRE